MKSKLGVHIQDVTNFEAMVAWFAWAQPIIAKLLSDDLAFLRACKEVSPQTFWIGRVWRKSQDLSSPQRAARQHFDRIMGRAIVGEVDCWEGFNEVSVDHLVELCEFDIASAELLHAEGLKYVAGSWSVGVPDIPDWQRPEMWDALRVADYIGVHEYCAPRMDTEFLVYPDDPDITPEAGGYFTVRYRKWWPTLPPDCQKPILITECGIDSGAVPHGFEHLLEGKQGGWQSFTTVADYVRQLAWYDSILKEDSHVKGATIYTFGTEDPDWATFDMLAARQELGEYIMSDDQEWDVEMAERLVRLGEDVEACGALLESRPPMPPVGKIVELLRQALALLE